MARPAAGYKGLLPSNVKGALCPGTTTVGKLIDDPGGLIHAAWALGAEGKNYREEWYEKAAGAGTLTHEMVEYHAAGHSIAGIRAAITTEENEPLLAKAWTGFDGYLRWASMSKLEILEQEQSYVAEAAPGLWYGGTLDAVGHCDGQLALLDWKTGKGSRIYPAVLLQIAAYRNLWEVHNPKDKLESFHVIRFDREEGSFFHLNYAVNVIDVAWDAFVHCRHAYELRAKLNRMV